MKKLKGKVKWFNSKMGYGFIESENIDYDIYVHFSNIDCDGYKELHQNDIVIFEFDEENYKALNVKIKQKYNRNFKEHILK